VPQEVPRCGLDVRGFDVRIATFRGATLAASPEANKEACSNEVVARLGPFHNSRGNKASRIKREWVPDFSNGALRFC